MRNRAAGVLLALASSAFGQTNFEVATVRINSQSLPVHNAPDGAPPPPPPPPSLRIAADRVTLLFGTLVYALCWAYDLRSWQISGPDWIRLDHYDIAAKAAGPVKESELKLMMQTLLVERFRMTVRRERKDAPVLALVVAKNGHKLREAQAETPASQKIDILPDTFLWTVRNKPLDILENILSGPWEPVVNMTGLTGTFDFTYSKPKRAESPGTMLGDVRMGLQKQLGLTLEPRKAPVDFLIVEKADKTPLEN